MALLESSNEVMEQYHLVLQPTLAVVCPGGSEGQLLHWRIDGAGLGSAGFTRLQEHPLAASHAAVARGAESIIVVI